MKHCIPLTFTGKPRYCTAFPEHRFEYVLDREVPTLLIQTMYERHQNRSNSLAANMNHKIFFSTFEAGSYCTEH